MAADRGPLLGEGREAEIFAWGDGQALRLLRDPSAGPRLEWEAAAMRAAGQAGVSVPAVDGVIAVDGRPGLVMERIVGTDLLTELGRRPLRFHRRARELGTLQARLHATAAPPGLPAVRERLRERIQLAPHLPDETRASTLELLDALPDGDALCHGDFHPGNVLVGESGPVIIDWVGGARGDAPGDLARTMLLLEVATRPDASAVTAAFDAIGRRWFRQTWRRAYERQRPVDPATFDRWMTVHTAARLADGFDDEVPSLLARLEARTSARA